MSPHFLRIHLAALYFFRLVREWERLLCRQVCVQICLLSGHSCIWIRYRLSEKSFVLFIQYLPFIQYPTSRDFVARSAASQPNIFYPEIHEVVLWQVWIRYHGQRWGRNRELGGRMGPRSSRQLRRFVAAFDHDTLAKQVSLLAG